MYPMGSSTCAKSGAETEVGASQEPERGEKCPQVKFVVSLPRLNRCIGHLVTNFLNKYGPSALTVIYVLPLQHPGAARLVCKRDQSLPTTKNRIPQLLKLWSGTISIWAQDFFTLPPFCHQLSAQHLNYQGFQ